MHKLHVIRKLRKDFDLTEAYIVFTLQQVYIYKIRDHTRPASLMAYPLCTTDTNIANNAPHVTTVPQN